MWLIYRTGTLLLILSLVATAQAADEVLTLACQGTTRSNYDNAGEYEPSSMGIIVNFTAKNVAGFRYKEHTYDIPVAITSADDMTITFRGSRKISNMNFTLTGIIDRVNGDAEVTYDASGVERTHSLKCKPTRPF